MIKCIQADCQNEASKFWKFTFGILQNGQVDRGNPYAEPFAVWAWCSEHSADQVHSTSVFAISEEEYIIHSVLSA